MTKDTIIKIVTDYFNQLEDANLTKYKKEMESDWNSTDSYYYTPNLKGSYAHVENNQYDTTIKYANFSVIVRDMPHVNIQSMKVEYRESIDLWECREELDKRMAHVRKLYFAQNVLDFKNATPDSIIAVVTSCQSSKRLVELHIVDKNFEI